MSAPLPAAGQPGIASDAHVAPAAPAVADPARRGIAAVQALVAAEMDAVDALIRARLDSDVVLIRQIASHIVSAGGKRLRPMLAVIAARALGHAGTSHRQLAAIVEFIHTSTLLHDDVVDESDMRRGRKTANALWGNAPSVLVGDFLYSRSFQLMVELDSMPVMRVLADTTNRIAEGEVLQLLHIGNPDTTEQDYLQVIECKTAVLFAAATRLGGALAGATPRRRTRSRATAFTSGLAFQVADDMLDYTADAATLGKNLGDDLAEGKATLPLIHALAHAAPELRARLAAIVAARDLDALPEIQQAIRAGGGIDYSRALAHRHADIAIAALDALPPGEWRDALRILAATPSTATRNRAVRLRQRVATAVPKRSMKKRRASSARCADRRPG
jgi:octaprenyl-diphosphate synthase